MAPAGTYNPLTAFCHAAAQFPHCTARPLKTQRRSRRSFSWRRWRRRFGCVVTSPAVVRVAYPFVAPMWMWSARGRSTAQRLNVQARRPSESCQVRGAARHARGPGPLLPAPREATPSRRAHLSPRFFIPARHFFCPFLALFFGPAARARCLGGVTALDGGGDVYDVLTISWQNI